MKTANSKTLTDNILYNNVTEIMISGNKTTFISDHLTQFLLASNQNPFSKYQMLNRGIKRSFTNSMVFEDDLKRVNWHEALTSYEENPKLSFKSFLNIVSSSSSNLYL